ncbi:MAG: FHA domain-containing protein [Spirochaetes bacterium]|nr:FHA domain-containing protein [Spirochaetota bacterium]
MFGHKTCKSGHINDPSWDVCPICISPICAWLVVLNTDFKNNVFTIHEGKNKIGTGVDCEIRILMESISRHHALFISKNSKYYLSDLNSLTGTYINNRQITSEEIIDNDIVKFGDVEFKFKCL